MRGRTRQSAGILGLGAAACVACCAGPIVAFLGGLSIAGLASVLAIGAAGLVVAALGVVGIVLVRRRRSTCPSGAEGPVAVATPTRRERVS